MTAHALQTDDYASLCEKVRLLCGVDLMQYKRGQMERRVRTWVQRRGASSLPVYGDLLRRDPDELDAFLDRVTINVSHLWRHEEQWDVLHKQILPELAARSGRVRAWSAGSSYGAEAFTLAAVCKEAVPRASVARWFPGGQATDELRRLVSFEVGDLLRMPIRSGAYDLVMCRNTVIYFTEEVRDALHRRLVDSLAPGGYLVVGASERVAAARELGLTSPFHFIYRKS